MRALLCVPACLCLSCLVCSVQSDYATPSGYFFPYLSTETSKITVSFDNLQVACIDRSGLIIDSLGLDRWNREKQNIINEKTALMNQIAAITNKASLNGWNNKKLAAELGDLHDRITSLNGTLDNLSRLETSSQVYALGTDTQGEGGMIYDSGSRKVIFNVGSTANFVHETTHGGQFENREIAFNKATGKALAEDLYDETSAYKAQFAFDSSSISKLKSNWVAHTMKDITPDWVQNLTGPDGLKPYAPGGSAHTGKIPLDINSTKQDYLKAYPNEAAALQNILPDTFTIRTYPGTYYKQ
jgi:hypothetical protein